MTAKSHRQQQSKTQHKTPGTANQSKKPHLFEVAKWHWKRPSSRVRETPTLQKEPSAQIADRAPAAMPGAATSRAHRDTSSPLRSTSRRSQSTVEPKSREPAKCGRARVGRTTSTRDYGHAESPELSFSDSVSQPPKRGFRPTSKRFEHKRTTIEFVQEERCSRAQFPDISASLDLWYCRDDPSPKKCPETPPSVWQTPDQRESGLESVFLPASRGRSKTNEEETRAPFEHLPSQKPKTEPVLYQNLRPAGHRNIETLLQANGPHRATLWPCSALSWSWSNGTTRACAKSGLFPRRSPNLPNKT